MNHLVTDVARIVSAERLRQAEHTRAGRRLSRDASGSRGTPRSAGARLVALSVVALLVVFTGSATAGAMITGKQIKNGTVTGADIRDASLSGVDIKDRTLTSDDFSNPIRGPRGEPGPQGLQGPPGVPGTHGASGLQYVVVANTVPASSTRTWAAHCPPGKRPVGGGLSNPSPAFTKLLQTAPLDLEDGWLVSLYNGLGSSSVTALRLGHLRGAIMTALPRGAVAVALAIVLAIAIAAAVVSGAEAGSRFTGRHIKDGTVTSKDVRDQGLTGLEVGDGSIHPVDLLDDVSGPNGPVGPAGDRGPAGHDGRPGVSGVVYRVSPAARVPQDVNQTLAVACPAGTRALGGGLSQEPVSADVETTATAPYDDGAGWRVSATNVGSTVSLYAWVACATAI